MIKLKALEVNGLNNGPDTFVESDGWLTNLKNAVVYNFVCLWRACPIKLTLQIFKNPLLKEIQGKERVTIMQCVNATLTHNLDLMIIRKAKSSRCFKNMDLPVHYKSSKNAWHTYTLFSDGYNYIFIPSVTRHLESKNLPVNEKIKCNDEKMG